MISIPLRILLVEDNETDALLIKRKIGKLVKEPEIELVEDLEACRHAMVNFVPDLVISDYNLPTCTGMDVLQLCQHLDPDLPFIFITGTIDDEELAANTILSGASGFILKKHMKELDRFLSPLLKKVVLRMSPYEEVRQQIRLNKASVNQIRTYLDSLNSPDFQIRKEQIERMQKELDRLQQAQRQARSDIENKQAEPEEQKNLAKKGKQSGSS